MNKRQLDYLDDVILDAVRISHSLNDTEIAGRLHCPRTFLLSRLERLARQGYIFHEADRISLTQKGASELVRLETAKLSQPADILAKTETFHWDYLYIPDAGWDRD